MSKRKKKKPNPDALFGELRAVLQSGALTQGQRILAWSTCIHMHKHHPAIYASVWLPYLESYASSWRPDLHIITTIDELREACLIAPFARFTLKSKLHRDARRDRTFHELLRTPLLQHIHTIETHNHDALQLLLDSPHIMGLKSVHAQMHSSYTIYDVIHALVCSSSHGTLESLVLTHGSDDSYRTTRQSLSTVAPFPNLHTLHLSHLPLHARDFSSLASAPMMKTISHLSIDLSGLYESLLGEFIKNETWGQLRSLRLSHIEGLTQRTTRLCEFIQHPALARIEHLGLTHNFRRYKPIALLDTIAAQPLKHMHTLDLSGNAIGITALKHLASSTSLEALRTLDLRDVTLDHSSSKLLATHPFFSRLDELHIYPYQLDHIQAGELATSATLSTHLVRRFAMWTPKLLQWTDAQAQ